MKSSTKRILNLLFIFSIFALVLYIGLKGNDPKQILTELIALPWYWLCIIIGCWIAYMVCETISTSIYFLLQGFKVPFFRMFRIVLIGNYYSSITPAATGGQPMQIYYFKKSGIPIGISTSILAVRFFMFQLGLIIVSSVLWFSNKDFVSTQLGGHMWILYMGYFFNGITVLAVLLLAINSRLVRFLVYGAIRILEKIHLVKKNTSIVNKIDTAIDNFDKSVRMIRNDPLQLLLQFLLTCIQFMCIFALTNAIYIALGLPSNTTTNIEILTMSALLFVAASYAPLPGASGAQEGGFALFFKNLFPGSKLFSALLLWRFASYYTTLLLGFIFTLFPMKNIDTRLHKNRQFTPQPKEE